MKFTFKSYELKNKSAPGTKTKQLKSAKFNLNENFKKRGGVIDNRKYACDTTLSEAEKISRRMALENMRRKSKSGPKKVNCLFSKENENKDDEWDNDPFNLKAKQIDDLDVGLAESSDEDNKDEDTEKYFKTDLLTQKKGKKTLDEIIRESKIEKYEKSKQKEKELEATTEVNEQFNKNFRFLLPKLGGLLNKKTSKDFQTDNIDWAAGYQKHFESLIYEPKLPKADVKSILAPIDDKDKDKIVNMKIKRLREHLVKEGITKNVNSDSEDAEITDESEDEEDDEDNEESEEEEDIDADDSDECSNDNEQDEEDIECSDDEDDESEDESDDQDDEVSETGPAETTLKDLKKMIFTRNKATKRQRVSDESVAPETAVQDSHKKPRLTQDEAATGAAGLAVAAPLGKTEIDCLRVLLQMPDLCPDAIVTLADALETGLPVSDAPDNVYKAVVMESGEANDVSRKLVLATLLHEALLIQSPNKTRYSPELVRALKCVLATVAARGLLTDMSTMNKSALSDICSLADDSNNVVSVAITTDNRTVSELWHVVSLLSAVIESYRPFLTNGRAMLAEPIQAVMATLMLSQYPLWLSERIEALSSVLREIESATAPVLRMRKRFHIVQLLEPDLIGAARHDPRRDVTKALKLRVKEESRNAKRDLREAARVRVNQEVSEARKDAQVRKQKTLEIMRGINAN